MLCQASSRAAPAPTLVGSSTSTCWACAGGPTVHKPARRRLTARTTDRRPLLMIDVDGHTQQEVADEPGCYSVRSRTVSPVRADRRAASRISVTIMLFGRDESPSGSISPRTTPRRYGTADS